jgi:hypothetical protein
MPRNIYPTILTDMTVSGHSGKEPGLHRIGYLSHE